MHPTVKTLRAQLRAEGIRLTVKRGWFWETIGRILAAITLGRLPRWRFMQGYHTTLANVIAITADEAERPVSVSLRAAIAHESVHVRQFRAFGLWLPWIGPWIGLVPMAAIYLLLPIPIGFAAGRWLLERPAYQAGMRIQLANGYKRAWLIDRVTKQLTGPGYFWAMRLAPGLVRWSLERGL